LLKISVFELRTHKYRNQQKKSAGTETTMDSTQFENCPILIDYTAYDIRQ